MTWLLRLYPREWRRRYGAELAEVIAAEPRSLQLTIDVLGGAVDAHLKPQALARQTDGATATHRGGLETMQRIKTCRATEPATRKEALVGAGLTLGSALVVAAILLISRNQVTETIAMTMFPGVLAIGMMPTYLRGHSTPARVALIGVPFLILLAIGLAAGLLASA